MTSLAPLSSHDASLQTGHVQTVFNDDIIIASAMGLVRAKRADGCLLTPQVGDKVLVFLSSQEAYVLNVLQKADSTAQMLLPKQTTLVSDSLRVQTSQDITLTAATIKTKANFLHFDASLASLTGKQLQLCFARIHSKATSMLSQIGRHFAFFGKVFEKVSGERETHAQRLRVTAEETLRVRAQRSDLRSEESVLIDGKNIKIG